MNATVQKSIIMAIALGALPCCSLWSSNEQNNKSTQSAQGRQIMDVVTLPSGLKYIIKKEADAGAVSPKAGQTVTVHYTGWLEDANSPNNPDETKKFDSSVDRSMPFQFPLGMGRVIKGWDEGVALMKIGETRRLIIPANLGYGARGAGGSIPPHATLIFDVTLLGAE